MLTVKHMEVTGAEVVYSAEKATYHPRVDHGHPGSAAYVSIDLNGKNTPLGSWGTFYIMNEAGKTVAKYELGGWTGETKGPITGTTLTPGLQGATIGGMALRQSPDGFTTATRVS